MLVQASLRPAVLRDHRSNLTPGHTDIASLLAMMC